MRELGRGAIGVVYLVREVGAWFQIVVERDTTPRTAAGVSPQAGRLEPLTGFVYMPSTIAGGVVLIGIRTRILVDHLSG